MVASGGGGTNVAVDLRRLGEAVKMISRIGNDGLGNDKSVRERGLDLYYYKKWKNRRVGGVSVG
jgi:sugar/nucleoside kinase (ribokinase family)